MMNNQEAIKILKNTAFLAYQPEPIEVIEEAVNKAISALQAQEIRDLLPVSPLLDKKKKKRKREAISAPQPQELSKNSTELDKENGELKPTCTGSCTGSEELKQEAKNSNESSLTQKALDTISRQVAIDAIDDWWITVGDKRHPVDVIKALPSVQPEPCGDAVSRKAVYSAMIEKGQRSRRYRLGEIWELNGTEIREALDTVPSAQPEIIYCKDCKYVGTDATCCLVCDRKGMGLKPYHVREDDYCSYAERRTNEPDK